MIEKRRYDSADYRVMVLTPIGRDTDVVCRTLGQYRLRCQGVVHMRELCDEMRSSPAGSVLLAEEALHKNAVKELKVFLADQPAWSDIPLVVLTSSGEGQHPSLQSIFTETPGRALLLERPVSKRTLISSVYASLQARERQYQVRDALEQHRQAEQALRESEQRLRALADAMPQLVWTALPDGTIDYYNARQREYQEICRTDDSQHEWNPAIHPDDLCETLQAWEEALRTGMLYQKEHRILMRDGQYRWHLSRSVPVRDQQGRLIRWYGTATDIHETKLAEEELSRARDELERRVRERTAELEERAEQLARLTSQLTLTEQRERQRLAEVLHDHLQQLLVAAKFRLEITACRVDEAHRERLEQVQELIDESIDASRSLTAELAPPILHEAGMAAGLEWLARFMKEKHDLAVDLSLEPGVEVEQEDVRVLLFQSVRELLFNVVKHAGVSEARLELASHPGELVRATVCDKGGRFKNIEQALEGEPRVDGGLGLFSIYERLNLLGGCMEIESVPEGGKCVTLLVPSKRPPEARQPGLRQETRARPARETSAPARQRIRILLADDQTVMREGLCQLLEMEDDMTVVGQAADGVEAVELARQLHPDVILMDSSMPRMHGAEATRAIRAEQPHVRIIGLSMFVGIERALTLIEAGADAYLTKSGSTEILLSTIRQHARRAD